MIFRMHRIVIAAALLMLTAFPLPAQKIRSDDRTVVQNVLTDAVSMLDTEPAKAMAQLEYLDKGFAPDDAVKYYLGLIYYSLKDYKAAEEYLVAATRLDSTNIWYKDALAGFYSALGRNSEAADLYIPLLEERPSYYANAYTLTLIGDRYLATYQDSLALDSYTKALALNPDYSPALLGRAETNRMSGNIPAFFADTHAFVLDPTMNPYAKCNYISQLLNHADYNFYRTWGAQLDTLVNSCVRTHPSDSSALKLAGSWYYSTGRKEKGMEYFDSLLEDYPDDLSSHYIRLSLLYDGGNMKQVLDECERIIEIGGEKNPEVIPALTTAGDCWHAIGNDSKAMKYYDKVLRLEPDNANTLNHYAYYLSLSGKNLKKAQKMSRTAVEKEPDNPSYLDTYGWILHLLGKDQEAKPYFKRALVYGGKDHLEILEHYSTVLEALGEKELSQYYRGLAENKKSSAEQ